MESSRHKRSRQKFGFFVPIVLYKEIDSVASFDCRRDFEVDWALAPIGSFVRSEVPETLTKIFIS